MLGGLEPLGLPRQPLGLAPTPSIGAGLPPLSLDVPVGSPAQLGMAGLSEAQQHALSALVANPLAAAAARGAAAHRQGLPTYSFGGAAGLPPLVPPPLPSHGTRGVTGSGAAFRISVKLQPVVRAAAGLLLRRGLLRPVCPAAAGS